MADLGSRPITTRAVRSKRGGSSRGLEDPLDAPGDAEDAVLQHWPGPTWNYGYLIQCCSLLYVIRFYNVVNWKLVIKSVNYTELSTYFAM